MKVIITFTFCCDQLWKSKFMALKKPRKVGEVFFSYFVATLLLFTIFFTSAGFLLPFITTKSSTPDMPQLME